MDGMIKMFGKDTRAAGRIVHTPATKIFIWKSFRSNYRGGDKWKSRSRLSGKKMS